MRIGAKIAAIGLAVLPVCGIAVAAESPAGGEPFPGYTVEVVRAGDYPDLKQFELPPQERLKRLTVAAPGGIADQLGLHPGDLLLSCSRINDADPEHPALQVGDHLRFQVLRFRNGKGTVEECDAVMPRVPGTRYEEYQEPESAQEFTRAAKRSKWRSEAEKVLRNAAKTAEDPAKKLLKNADDDLDDLERRLAAAAEWHDPFLMAAVNYLFHRPAALEAVGRAWAAQTAGKTTVAELLGAERSSVEFDGSSCVLPSDALPALPAEGAALESFLDYIAAVLDRAGTLNAQALQALPPNKVAAAQLQRDEWAAWLPEYRTPAADPDGERALRMLELCRTLAQVDRGALRQQAAVAGALLDPVFLARLKRASEAVRTKTVVAERETPWGKIVIAGTGDDLHLEPCAVLIDLGGSDCYCGNHAASVPFRMPTAVVIDLAGDDRYEAVAPAAQGYGGFGIGLLYDAEGNDTYLGTTLAQGCGFGGFGFLIDLAGDDAYAAGALAQGTAWFGAGFLADGAGNDVYRALHYAQGLGLVRGYGLLTDGGGSDFYCCKGGKAASGKKSVGFEGWGQGMGLGMHPYCSGGIGMLCDAGNGDNRFDGGTHAMGGGCGRGFGLLACLGGGKDRYHATRHALGFALHQAVGWAWDAGGDDGYTTLSGMIAGVAWERSLAQFLDDSGNDSYAAGSGFSLGAAGVNGMALFRDGAGEDVYRTAEGPAAPARNGTAGGASLAVFCDEGGALDHYPPGRSDDSTAGELRFSVFIDR